MDEFREKIGRKIIPASEELHVKTAIRRVALVYNPVSGPHSSRRDETVRSAKEALESAGIEVEHLTIDGPGSGRVLAREAAARGCDSVIVCGGDGTVHEVLQALVGTEVALGVVPDGGGTKYPPQVLLL